MAINPVSAADIQEDAPRLMIGELLAEAGRLTEHDVKRVLVFQRKKNLRFGEAVQRLGLATDDDVQQALARQFNFPWLRRGEGGVHPLLISAYQPFSEAAEAFRILRGELMLRWFDRGHKTLAIGSAREGAGTSMVAANLAVSFAQLGERVLLIDANFRMPIQDELFGISAEMGLAAVLLGRIGLERAVVTIAELNGLAVLCAGPVPPNPHELLSGAAFRNLLEFAQDLFDVVLIDTPAILASGDGQMIAARAEGHLLVTRRHRTRVSDVEKVRERLAPGGTTLVGAIVND